MSAIYVESMAKKVSRAECYVAALSACGEFGLYPPVTVALCGPNANDARILEGVLGDKWDRSLLTLVDCDSGYIAKAAEEFPGVNTRVGMFHEVDLPKRIGLAVMDFCGHAESESSLLAMKSLRNRVQRGSVVILTYYRARDPLGSGARFFLRRLDKRGERGNINDQQERALSAMSSLVRMTGIGIGDGGYFKSGAPGQCVGVRSTDLCWRVVWSVDYSGSSPMGMVVLQAIRRVDQRRFGSWRVRVRPMYRERSVKDEVLAFADMMQGKKLNAAALLCVKPGTLAAWRAHRTMGTYSEA